MDWRDLATVFPTGMSAAFYTLAHTTAVWATMAHRPLPRFLPCPRVTVLKPVAGADDELRENLESFARVDYPAYEILLGVASASDPAVPIVEAFIAAHPDLEARLILTTPTSASVINPKVAQLIDLTRQARGSVLVVSDANVRVRSSYLHSMVAALMEPGVGLVSSVIRGTGEQSFGAAIENAQLSGYVAPAVVAAAHLFRRPITIGKSMAMRRADLAGVGGWEVAADVLAEDDVMGRRFSALGHGVRLCLEPVDNRNVGGSLLRSIGRHARWAQMRRALAPQCFAAEPLLTPLLVASATLVLSPSALAAQVWLCALGAQLTGALLSHTLQHARHPVVMTALEPVRVFAYFASWCLAALSRKVEWRGKTFVIGAGSRLTPAPAEAPTPVAVGR